jgi:hypothetical protein
MLTFKIELLALAIAYKMSFVSNWEAGPGSYNLSENLATHSQVHFNAPRPVFYKGKRNPSLFISNAQCQEWLGTCSPPVNKYSPNSTLLYKSSSMPRFGKEQRKDYFLISQDRSPGPIYSLPDVAARGSSFGKGKKYSTKANDLPSPDAYNPRLLQTRLPVKIKGYISERAYEKNLEKYYSGQIGPGPAGYSLEEKQKKGGKLPRAGRMIMGIG